MYEFCKNAYALIVFTCFEFIFADIECVAALNQSSVFYALLRFNRQRIFFDYKFSRWGGTSMELKLELLTSGILDAIINSLKKSDIDIDCIAQTTAISALEDIRECIKNDNLSDFDVIEEIVNIFEKYHIDCGCRHDF